MKTKENTLAVEFLTDVYQNFKENNYQIYADDANIILRDLNYNEATLCKQKISFSFAYKKRNSPYGTVSFFIFNHFKVP